jgi:hypothetical protein
MENKESQLTITVLTIARDIVQGVASGPSEAETELRVFRTADEMPRQLSARASLFNADGAAMGSDERS